ncbi:TasA family protein [Oceanobacillus sp. 1P07AA]|uniref:TasA family protein n=1 Tax=Oceanobacillus sp. 1P07AA TaxID=3132293 RepID=UPI0039A6FEB7
MKLKKKLGMGVATAVLGLGLIGGGTFAYFSDTATTNNTFAAGTLDLSAQPETIINVGNIKPGDYMIRTFNLSNQGSLDIKNVLLDTEYEVVDANGNNGNEDFGEHIEVSFLANIDKVDVPIFETTLAELKNMDPEVVDRHLFYPWLGDRGLPVGTSDDLIVQFKFVDNGEDQNIFQGDSLELTWSFTGHQTEGEAK